MILIKLSLNFRTVKTDLGAPIIDFYSDLHYKGALVVYTQGL